MDALTTPVRLRCGLALRDRIAMAPLTNTQSHPDGTLADDELEWLTRRARDGFGWISTCAAFVSEEGHAWKGQLGIASDDHLPGLTRLASSLHEHDAIAVVQLHHGGAKADLAPTKLSTGGPEGCRAATSDDLARVTADFVAAAQRAEAAGFDGVEIHGANRYLFTQFLAPADNPRDDAYGGTLDGRARLLRETMRAVRDAVAPKFAVGVRLSPVDLWNVRGLKLADGVQVGQWLVDDGADFVHLSLMDAGGTAPHEPEAGVIARAFREALQSDVPIFAAGGVWTRPDAKRARDAGVDVVVIGRASIAHPDWPRASAAEDFAPHKPPWSEAFLTRVAVGANLVAYLSGMSGMVEGGKAAR